MSQSEWTWSPDHNDHYAVLYDAAGNITAYVWASQTARVDSPVNQASGSTVTQMSQTVQDTSQQPPEPVPHEVRLQEPNFIAGTPARGWREELDNTYRMRTGLEARDFFRIGRVFSMLFIEAAGETSKPNPDDDAFTIVRLGGTAHTQIRRFVVVSVRKGFVHACAISTYRNQGTFKRGCDPTEHALVYNSGVDPELCYFLGEKQQGLKEPIEVTAANYSTLLTKESRIRFGKIYSIEWNVKVKDIGMVVDRDLGTLIEHHNFENQKWDTV